jgi:NAD(P)H dehydrogenase (quinone)
MVDTKPQAAIGVIGAAGRSGRRALAALRARAQPAAALVRRPEARRLAIEMGATDARLCDYADGASMVRALRGIERLLVIPPGLASAEDTYVLNAIAAARDAGVRRVVLLSVLHPHHPPMPHHMRKASAEHGLRCSALEWTILQPAMFAQSPLAFIAASPPGQAWAPFDLDAPFTPIDLVDVAEVAATALLEDGHVHASYELAGRERVSFREISVRVATIGGRPLRAVSVRPRDFVARTPRLHDRLGDFAAMCEDYSRHGMIGNANVARMLLGREPTTVGDVIRREIRPNPEETAP